MQKVAEPSRRGGAVTEYLARARVGTRSTCPRGSSRAGQPRVPTATTPGAIGATRSGIGRVARDWPPWKGRKKRVVNRLADCARERILGPWAGPVDVPSEHSTTVDLAWAIDGEPVSEPQFLGEAVSPRAPVTQRCEQVPVPVSARSTAVYPVGGRWPVWCAALAIQLVTRVKLSLRSTPKALEVVFGFLRGRVVTTTMMAWTTVRCWLMRLGLYALLRPL